MMLRWLMLVLMLLCLPARVAHAAELPEAVTFNLGVALGANLLFEGRLSTAGLDDAERNAVLAFGSVQRAGLRPLPLIHVPLSDAWGVDAYAVGAYLPSKRGWVETYMAGVSFRD